MTAGSPPPALIVAVDGGGSKTDVVALDEDGNVLAQVRGDGSSPHLIGLEASISLIGGLVMRVVQDAGGGPLLRTHVYLSGLDLPAEIVAFERGITSESWDAGALVVDNDLFALLRAGTGEPDAVAVICGTGINCVGVRSDGRTVRYPSLGMISGDWGGGFSLGQSGLWHAARAEDGRGPATVLRREIPLAFGLNRVQEVTEALHFGQIDRGRLADLCPVVFEASAVGDEVAASIVDRQAEEIVALAATTIKRLGLLERPVPVVLGGGVIAARDKRLLDGIRRRLATDAPQARTEIVSTPPILGAALLACGAHGASASALEAARSALTARNRQPSVDVRTAVAPSAPTGLMIKERRTPATQGVS